MKYERLTDKNDLYWSLQETKLSAEVGIYLTDCLNRLAEFEDKIEQGTLFEIPFIWKSKKNNNEYIVVFEDEETGRLLGYCCVGDDAKEEAQKKLKELQDGI